MGDGRAGTYFIWDGVLLYMGPGGRSDFHAHHLIQVGVAAGRSIKVRTARDEPYVRCQAFVLDADVPHQVVCASRTPINFLWIDPESDRARRLHAARPDIAGRSAVIDILEVAPSHDVIPKSCAAAAHVRASLLAQLGAADEAPLQLDDRVRMVIDTIRSSLHDESPAVDALAASVYLSPSRLMHLFSEQIGIPIRRYILWQRLMLAIDGILGGANLTSAAIESGFSDSAHMSRTFRDMFGVTPSTLFKNSRFVQAVDCSSA